MILILEKLNRIHSNFYTNISRYTKGQVTLIGAECLGFLQSESWRVDQEGCYHYHSGSSSASIPVPSSHPLSHSVD
jgi:hypothetical protein